MLKVEFAGYPKAEAVIWQHKMDNARGIVECTSCKNKATLYKDEDVDISGEIEFFIKNHRCIIKGGKENEG